MLLIKSYKTFIKEYHDAYKQFCESILNAESNFLGEEGFESYVINTPFFQFGKEIKNILKVQREQFDSIVKNQVNTLEKKIADLYDDLKKLHKYEDTFTDFMNQMYESLNELERKYVDDYINGKYQKHIKYYSNKNKEDIFTAISYMNNSCLLTKQKYKETFVRNNNTLVTTFNEMKTIFKELIEIFKNNGKNNLDELQKSVELFSFGEIIETETEKNEKIEENENEKNEENKNEIIEDNKVENREEKGIMNDLDKLFDKKFEIPKYKLNIIKNATFEVTKAKDGKKKNYEQLTLDNEVIYSIVETMYNDHKNLIDQTEYDLDKQITVSSLSKKLIYSTITDEQYKTLLGWLDNEDNLTIFYMVLTASRTKIQELDNKRFEIILEIFQKTLEKMCKKHNKKIERNIIIISDTFYKLENDKKIYISDKIKGHKLFSDKTFWENVAEYEVNSAIKNLEEEKKKEDNTMISLMTICNSVKTFAEGADADKKKEIIKALFKKCQYSEKKYLNTYIDLFCN